MMITLTYRDFKRRKEISLDDLTGRARWVRWTDPEGHDSNPPLYGWIYDTYTADTVDGLENAVYVGTLTVHPSFSDGVIENVWAMPERRSERAIPDGFLPVDTDAKDVPNDLYFVKDAVTGEWDLYSTSGDFPDTVAIRMKVAIAGGSIMQDYDTPIVLAESDGDPKFEISPSSFVFTNTSERPYMVGDLVYDSAAVSSVKSVEYDANCNPDECVFFIEHNLYSYELYTRFTVSESQHVIFSVPLLIKYVDGYSGETRSVRKVFEVHGICSEFAEEPYVKYVRNLASKTGTTAIVQILGEHFEPGMTVRIKSRDGEFTKIIQSDELVFDTEGKWDRIGFVVNSDTFNCDASADEQCAVYDLDVGYGSEGGFFPAAGTNALGLNLENNIGLIRFKYDYGTKIEQNKASAGTMVTTDSPCFYSTDIDMVYDSDGGGVSNSLNGGAAGKYGKTMYVKMDPSIDCDSIRYIRIKLKYNKRVDDRFGEMTLDDVRVTDGDIIWLAGQMDGTDGLWIVRADREWEGLKDYLEPSTDPSGEFDPCSGNPGRPLPVDGHVFIDLGARVSDTADYRCDLDVPVKYGSIELCAHTAMPGDLVLLANQSDGMDGLWEVTCGDWIFRGHVNDDGTPEFNASDQILYQNNIDFCACASGQKNPVFNIEYYYLNGGCYVATAVRKVKLLCAGGGSLLPNNNVIVTDYSITAGANRELVVDTHTTAGDGVPEDCTLPKDDFEQKSGVPATEVSSGCSEGGTSIRAPQCNLVCDCPRYFELNKAFSMESMKTGFSMVFWQLEDGGWHYYAYSARNTGTLSREYYVYHLHVCGSAVPSMVDENGEVDILVKDSHTGLMKTVRTKDAWFVSHGGQLAPGFGMYDAKWMMRKELPDDEVAWIHWLDADTLYQNWALHGIDTKMLAHPVSVDDGEQPAGMEHIHGFRFYNVPMTKERFCQLYNETSGNCTCQDTSVALVTDQCYDELGNAVDCDAPESYGNAGIVTDADEVLLASGAPAVVSGKPLLNAQFGAIAQHGVGSAYAGQPAMVKTVRYDENGLSMGTVVRSTKKIYELQAFAASANYDPETHEAHIDYTRDAAPSENAAWVAATIDQNDGNRLTVRLPLPVAGEGLEQSENGALSVNYDDETMMVLDDGKLGVKATPDKGVIFSCTGLALHEARSVFEFSHYTAGIVCDGVLIAPDVYPEDTGTPLPPGDIVVPANVHWVYVDATLTFNVKDFASSIWSYDCVFSIAIDGGDVHECQFSVDTTVQTSVIPCSIGFYNLSEAPMRFNIGVKWVRSHGETDLGVTCSADIIVKAN